MPPTRTSETDDSFAWAVMAELSLGLAAIMLGWWIGPNAREHIPQWWDGAGIFRAVVWGLVAGVGLVGMMQLLGALPFRGIRRLHRVVDARLQAILMPMSTLQMVVLSLTAGIGEELLFRGWLQRLLIGPMDGEWVVWRATAGVTVAGVLFGLAHPFSRTYIVLASIMGMMLGGLYLFTQNLLAPILAHAVYDAIVLITWKRGQTVEPMNCNQR
jgi:uncharacterized protein